MTAAGFIRASAELEALAGQLLNAGSARAGGEMLYGALSQVIIAVAIRRGAPYREHQHRRHLIRSLARELDDPDIADAFRFAQRMHVHFYLVNMPDDRLADAVAATRGLISRLLPLAA